MLFSSYEFISAFLPVTLAVYFLLGKRSGRAAKSWLLFASFFFYAWWDVRFLPLLVFSILWNYASGRLVALTKERRILCRAVLFASAAVNLGLLGYFKYADFFIKTANRAFHTDWNLLNVVLPLGISFYTFQAVSYVADVYLGRTSAEKSLLDLALYISLFPQLIAGPIVDHKMMIPQFADENRRRFSAEHFSAGIALFSLALFKKVVIADSLSPVVADIFGRISSLTMLDAWGRGALLRVPALLRFFSLLGDGNRLGENAEPRLSHELRFALSGGLDDWLLAALAHHARLLD